MPHASHTVRWTLPVAGAALLVLTLAPGRSAFGGADHVDVLLTPGAVRDDTRREPTLGDLPAEAAPAPDRLADVHASEARPGRDSTISQRVDTIATVAAPQPVPVERLELLLDALQAHTVPVHVEGEQSPSSVQSVQIDLPSAPGLHARPPRHSSRAVHSSPSSFMPPVLPWPAPGGRHVNFWQVSVSPAFAFFAQSASVLQFWQRPSTHFSPSFLTQSLSFLQEG